MKRIKTKERKSTLAPARFLLALMLMLPTWATRAIAATEFITDVMVIGNNNQTDFYDLQDNLEAEGWTAINKDLNAGCGSGTDYIHLLYKTTNSTTSSGIPITDFYIKTGKSAPSSLTHDGRTYYLAYCDGSTNFVNSSGDLNRGAGGDYIRLYYTKDALTNSNAVTAITFNNNQSGAVGSNGGSTGYDLNSGAGGNYIYMHVATAPYSPDTPVSNTTVTIGNNGSFGSYPFLVGNSHQLEQQIFTAEEIGMAGTITSIAYNCDQSFSMNGVQVYLTHTNKLEFESKDDLVALTPNDKVYEGSHFSPSAGWATITLDTPFEYDGSSNLLVSTCNIEINDDFVRCKTHNTRPLHQDIGCNFFENIPDVENLNYTFSWYSCERSNIKLNIIPSRFANPANLCVGDFTDVTATLTWNAPKTNENITGYAYQYKKVADAGWSAEIPLGRTATSVTLSGLSGFTDYQFRVKTLYGDNYSSYAFIRFTTAMSLPYEYGFEDGMGGFNWVDINWSHTEIIEGGGYESEHGFKFSSFTSGEHGPQYLISPRFATTKQLTASFYYFRETGNDPTFKVGYSTKTDAITDFIWVTMVYPNYLEWLKFERTFPKGTKYIAISFDHNSSELAFNLYLDDFSFYEHSEYAQPENLAVNMTDHSATLTWTAPNTSVRNYVQYKKHEETGWSEEDRVEATTVTLENLTTNTDYDFRMKALYEGDNASNYVSTSFMTEGVKERIPHYQGFENGMGGWRIVGHQESKIVDNWYYTEDAHEGNHSFKFMGNNESQYLISPQLDGNSPLIVTFYTKNWSNATMNATVRFDVGYSQSTKELNQFAWTVSEISDKEWRQTTVFCPAGTKYIVIRMVSAYLLFIDDIIITTTTPPSAPQQLTVTNVNSMNAELSWTGDAETYQVRFRPKPLMEEDFENGQGDWKIVRYGNGTANTDWRILNLKESTNWAKAHSGTNAAVSISYDYATSVAYGIDNWLISPQVTLNGTLEVWSLDTGFSISDIPIHEQFAIWVSTKTDDIRDFEWLSSTYADDSWKVATFDLRDFNGVPGYIAIRHRSYDQPYLAIDDVGIYLDKKKTVAVTGENITLTGLQPNTEYECQVRANLFNCVTEWTDVVTFTTNSMVQLADNAENTSTIAAITYNQECNVKLQGRTLYKNGDWNTLCLPFNVTIADSPLAGADVRELDSETSGLEGTTLTLNFTEVPSTGEQGGLVVAGKPYLIKWASGDNIVNPVFSGVTIVGSSVDDNAVAFTGGKFTGTYDYRQYMEEDKSILFLGSNNKLYYPLPDLTSSPAKYPSIGAFRAYFQLDDGITAGDVSGVRLFFGDSEATGVSLTPDPSPKGEGSIYTLNGMKLQGKPTQKGLYIHGGRKTVVK